MTSRDFCFWLQGFFEVSDAKSLTAEQSTTVKRHLAMVFAHEIDPKMGSQDHQAILDKLHKTEAFPSGSPHGELKMRC